MSPYTDLSDDRRYPEVVTDRCAACDRVPETTLRVSINGGPAEVFDSWRCALHSLAPICSSCGGAVLDEGLLIGAALLCSARCASRWRLPAQTDGRMDGQTDGSARQLPADVGDRLIVRGHRADEVNRNAEVLEVRTTNGAPVYVVRWSDDGHIGLFSPGPDTLVEIRPRLSSV